MSVYKQFKFIESVDKNEQKKCDVANCFMHRRKVSKHCRKHAKVQALYGHPSGRSISKKEYLGEQHEAERFLKKFADHKAVLAGITFFESWLRQAQEGKKVAGINVLKRMLDSGVTGRDCLHIVLAIWLYSRRQHSKLPDDTRLTFAFSYAFVALCNKGKRAGVKRGRVAAKTSERRRIGEVIREKLGRMVFQSIEAMDKMCDREDELRNALIERF